MPPNMKIAAADEATAYVGPAQDVNLTGPCYHGFCMMDFTGTLYHADLCPVNARFMPSR